MSVADKLGFGPKREITVSDDQTTITITITPPTFMKAPPQKVKLTRQQFNAYKAWRDDVITVQQIPGLSEDDCERLMTGLGPTEFTQAVLDECVFTFDDLKHWKGYALGSTWNGFDNVIVTKETWEAMIAYYGDPMQGNPEAANDFRALEPRADGFYSLQDGFSTRIVPEGWPKGWDLVDTSHD